MILDESECLSRDPSFLRECAEARTVDVSWFTSKVVVPNGFSALGAAWLCLAGKAFSFSSFARPYFLFLSSDPAASMCSCETTASPPGEAVARLEKIL
jgi:hypothetical protein